MTRRGPLRVLIVIAQLGRGGAERQVYDLATRLDRSAIHPTIMTFSPDVEYRQLLEDAGIEVIAFDKAGWREASTVPRMAALIVQRRIDIVHPYLFPAAWRSVAAARLAGGRPVIYGVRNTSDWMGARHRFMDRLALRWATVVVVNAPSLSGDILSRTGLSPDRVRVIMNGVDTRLFSPGSSAFRDQWTLNPATAGRLVGFIGALEERKDPCFFVRLAGAVARQSPGIRFVMVGEGSMRSQVESCVRAEGLEERLLLCGRIQQMPEVLRAIDLLVVSSVREGCSNVILEAMATGVPVVATSVGGTPDIVTHGRTGWLYPHGDVEAGSTAILQLASDPALSAQMGAAALSRAQREFSIETMVRATSGLYRELA